MKKIIPMMFCFDSNYVIPASVAFYSLLEHQALENIVGGGGVEFRLYVIHNDISQQNQIKLQDTISPFSHFATLEFIDGNGVFKEIWKQMKNHYHFAPEMFYKLMAPSLFPQYDKMIISDVDVVFKGSVIDEFECFDTEEDFLIGGVVSNDPEAFFSNPFTGYRKGYAKFTPEEQKALANGIDAAYLIINLLKWRKLNIENICLDYLNKNYQKLILPEQDILGLTCHPYIKKISNAYVVSNTSWQVWGENFQNTQPNVYTQKEFLNAANNPIQIHYAGASKPWNTPGIPKSELWFTYLCKTAFIRDYLEKLENIILQKHYKNSWKYQITQIFKNPKKLFKPSNYLKLFEKLGIRH